MASLLGKGDDPIDEMSITVMTRPRFRQRSSELATITKSPRKRKLQSLEVTEEPAHDDEQPNHADSVLSPKTRTGDGK